MNCPLDPEILSQFLDGDLPEEKLQAIGAHVEICDRCATELAALRETMTLVREAGSVKAPPALREKIRAQLQEEDAKPPAKGTIVQLWGARVAATILVLLAGAALVVTVRRPAPLAYKNASPEQIAAVNKKGAKSDNAVVAKAKSAPDALFNFGGHVQASVESEKSSPIQAKTREKEKPALAKTKTAAPFEKAALLSNRPITKQLSEKRDLARRAAKGKGLVGGGGGGMDVALKRMQISTAPSGKRTAPARPSPSAPVRRKAEKKQTAPQSKDLFFLLESKDVAGLSLQVLLDMRTMGVRPKSGAGGADGAGPEKIVWASVTQKQGARIAAYLEKLGAKRVSLAQIAGVNHATSRDALLSHADDGKTRWGARRVILAVLIRPAANKPDDAAPEKGEEH